MNPADKKKMEKELIKIMKKINDSWINGNRGKLNNFFMMI